MYDNERPIKRDHIKTNQPSLFHLSFADDNREHPSDDRIHIDVLEIITVIQKNDVAWGSFTEVTMRDGTTYELKESASFINQRILFVKQEF